MVPVNELKSNSKYSYFDSDPIVGGKVPVIILSVKSSDSRFVNNPIVLGMVDVRRMLLNLRCPR